MDLYAIMYASHCFTVYQPKLTFTEVTVMTLHAVKLQNTTRRRFMPSVVQFRYVFVVLQSLD